MKKVIIIILCFTNLTVLFAQSNTQQFIFSDIDNFWVAYDKIITTKDSVQQYEYLNKLYIEKGSDGLKSIMDLKQYTPKKYLDAINKYPLFWQSIRHNSNESKNVSGNIEIAINKLKSVYSELKPVPIYFTIGVFRTNGTGINDRILIGSEMALTDKKTKFDELPDYLHYFYTNYTKSFETIDLLCVHEYIHTQQKELVQNLLSASLYEGVAEFVSSKVVDKPSNAPAIAFGKQNEEKVKTKFEQDMFIPNRFYDWLWSSDKNSFDVRDLGYYIGYAICERNYEMTTDKKKAIKEMIELDYTNEEQIENFVDRTSFFSSTLKKLNQKHEKLRPTVISIEQFKNGSQNVSPTLKKITLNFSSSMDKNNRGFDFGPLGESNVLRVKNSIGFSDDGKSFTFEIELKPNKRYQILISNRFCKTNGIPLKPFLVDIKTADK